MGCRSWRSRARAQRGRSHRQIEAVLPPRLRHIILESTVIAAIEHPETTDALDMARVRVWIRERKKLKLEYQDEQGRISSRTIWPVAAAYFENAV